MAGDMNGAESLVRTLLAGGVNVCFANPGTSEMHFVAALDKVPGMRCVLGLFEGVVTGAADGYYRMLGKPASTLLHLGPGLANGLANLHNAKKANSGIVNIVGEHATYHIAHDAPLTSDIEGVARPMSHWVKTSPNFRTIAADGALAIAAARQTPGQIATLILPADTAWGPATALPRRRRARRRRRCRRMPSRPRRPCCASGERATLLMGGDALRAPCLELAGRIAAKTGCGILTEGANTRLERGAGRVQVERIPYVVDKALGVMREAGNLVLVGAREPVAFFAYPDKPSLLMAPGARSTKLAASRRTCRRRSRPWPSSWARWRRRRPACRRAAPARIADRRDHAGGDRLDPRRAAARERHRGGRERHHRPRVLPRDRRRAAARLDQQPRRLDRLRHAGRDRRRHRLPRPQGRALEGDGSAMYTLQSLWTMAREGLDVTMVVFANGTYNILRGELTNVGVRNPGPRAVDMLSIGGRISTGCRMARGMGVEGRAPRRASN